MAHPRLAATTRDHVLRAARLIKEPKPIQKWSCIVRINSIAYELPVKQLLMVAANLVESQEHRLTPADFTAHIAVKKLERLGLEVRYQDE